MKLIIGILLALNTSGYADEGVQLIEDAFIPEIKVIESEVESNSRKCTRTRFKTMTPNPLELSETRNIEFVEYLPKKEVKEEVIMMPPTGGVSLVDRQLAKRLCKDGIHVLLHYHFTGDTEGSLDPKTHEKAFIRAITAIKHMALKFKGQYGVIGSSLGSLYASQALAVEPRIKKALLVVGGAPITEILTYSDQEGLVELREARMKEQNLSTREEYKSYLDRHFRLELLSRLRPANKKIKIWKVRSLKDQTVPTENQSHLIDLLNPMKLTDSKAGHVRTIVNLLFKKGQVADFFLKD